MKDFYKRIDGKKYRHVYIVADIHGKYKQFLRELKDWKFDKEQDLVVGVGDLIDRGFESLDVLRLLDEKWFVSVIGNHEQMAYDAICGSSQSPYLREWLDTYGFWYKILDRLEKDEARERVKEVYETYPRVIEIEVDEKRSLNNRKKIVVCHALYPNSSNYEFNKKVDENDLIWTVPNFKALEKEIEDLGFDEDYEFYFGHYILPERKKIGNLNFIDLGGFLDNGELSVIRIQ